MSITRSVSFDKSALERGEFYDKSFHQASHLTCLNETLNLPKHFGTPVVKKSTLTECHPFEFSEPRPRNRDARCYPHFAKHRTQSCPKPKMDISRIPEVSLSNSSVVEENYCSNSREIVQSKSSCSESEVSDNSLMRIENLSDVWETSIDEGKAEETNFESPLLDDLVIHGEAHFGFELSSKDFKFVSERRTDQSGYSEDDIKTARRCLSFSAPLSEEELSFYSLPPSELEISMQDSLHKDSASVEDTKNGNNCDEIVELSPKVAQILENEETIDPKAEEHRKFRFEKSKRIYKLIFRHL